MIYSISKMGCKYCKRFKEFCKDLIARGKEDYIILYSPICDHEEAYLPELEAKRIQSKKD